MTEGGSGAVEDIADSTPSSPRHGRGNRLGNETNSAETPPSEPDDPPPEAAVRPPAKHSHPFSQHVLAILAPSGIFGLLARLGLEALTDYDGQSVFSLAWVQGIGCFIMGLAAGLREPISQQ